MCGRRTDRISNLPDDLLHKILYFISIDDAITTSFLSRRWRYLWTSIPYLNFINEDSDFVDNVLSRLNNQIRVSSFKLVDYSSFSHDLVKRIVNFAASHNVQQLTIMSITVLSATWELPALTTLHLHEITLSATDPKGIDLISKCSNLKNLTLTEFQIEGTEVLNIFHPQLSTLKIEDIYAQVELLNVVTPQLKNLTIRSFSRAKHVISAPELVLLVLKGEHPWELSTEGFPFLEKVKLHFYRTDLTMAHKMVCLLQQFYTVKFIKLNLEVLELLSSFIEGISHQSFAFPNLKISKFSPNRNGRVYMEAQENVVTDSKSRDTSPSVIFTMFSCEEIQVMRKLVSAKENIEELWIAAWRCKRKRGKVQVKKQCVQSEFEMQWHFGEMMEQIEQEEIDGLLANKFPVLKTRNMISSLQCIAGLLTELPVSNRSALQVALTSLCEEAAILMNKYVMGDKKKQLSRARKPKAHPKERK